MTIWFVFALMTAAAIFAVLYPLSRRRAAPGGSDVAVYRDQLAEIDRDRTAGLIADAEAEAAKVEVSRRLIAAADAAEAEPARPADTSLWRRRAAALAGIVLLPIGAAALYLTLGSPQMPGEPLVARLRAIHEDKSIGALVSQVEAHLERNPNDLRGYEVLAPVYLQLGRFDDAVRAQRKILALGGESAERQADLGVALMAAANGVVTDEAKAAFDRAQQLDPRDPKSKFYIGVAAEQDGERAKAAEIWRGMLAKAPANAPWIATVREALAQVGGEPVASAPNSGAAANISEQDRKMIDGMVARLADRLKKDGSDVEGWLRLVHSYRVLGENDKVQAAIADARHALAGDAEKLGLFEQGESAAASAPAAIATPSTPTVGLPGPNAAEVAAAANMNEQDRSAMIRGMVARLADKLRKDGSDIEGWERLVRSYRVLGDKAKAQAAIADARQALANDPDKLRAFNETTGAAASVPPAVAAAPAASAPGPSAADVAAAAKLSEQGRSAMIHAMVARLADRLKQDGSDLEGWQRLLRAYMVMGERDKAHAAAADARRALASDPDKLRRINEIIKGLGLES